MHQVCAFKRFPRLLFRRCDCVSLFTAGTRRLKGKKSTDSAERLAQPISTRKDRERSHTHTLTRARPIHERPVLLLFKKKSLIYLCSLSIQRPLSICLFMARGQLVALFDAHPNAAAVFLLCRRQRRCRAVVSHSREIRSSTRADLSCSRVHRISDSPTARGLCRPVVVGTVGIVEIVRNLLSSPVGANERRGPENAPRRRGNLASLVDSTKMRK